jgi:outer membrane protein assembly factor BamB
VHIVVYCPDCQSRYHLNSDLAGRRMRCPNPACRTTFTVKGAETGPDNGDGAGPAPDLGPSPPPVSGARVANAYGEMVPMGRPVRRDDVPIARPAPQPVEDLDWRTAPPPVQGAGEPARGAYQTPSKTVTPAIVETDPSPRRHRSVLLILGLIAGIGGLTGVGIWAAVHRLTQSEERLRADAEADYKAERYRPAQKKYAILSEKFGRGERGVQYRLLADLADLHDRASGDLGDASDTARRFVENYSRNPALDQQRDDLAKVLLNIGGLIASRAEQQPQDVDDLLRRGDQMLALIDRYPPRGDQRAELRKQFDRIRGDATRVRERRARIEQIRLALQQSPPDLARAKRIMREAGLESDPAVLAEIELARKKLGDLVKYEPLNRKPQNAAPPDGPPSILLETAPPPPRSGSGEVVLAVARGLLYALDARNGRRLWVTRVGPDADSLPVRVPGRGEEPELVLVAATDPPTLTARDLRTGAVRWHQPLEAAPLGRPVFDGINGINQLYVPTAGERGVVYDLDARNGTLLGQFATHQPLAGGAALDQTYFRLYVPAYGDHVYVFNYHPDGGGPPRREGLLATGHAPGGLRGEPIVVSGEEGIEVPRYLVLGEADGLDAMKLRAFQLVSKPDIFAGVADVRLPGWSWFPPYADSEKIALVTDAGALGLFGIRQKGNEYDAPLFPLLGFDPPAAEGARQPLRAQLVHAEEYGFWVLAGGALQHWRLGLDRAKGRILAPVWGAGVPLGSPLHATQVSADRSTLYLVTQTEVPSTSLATAVDARTGRVQWQRPLGLSSHGDPLRIGDALLVMAPNAAVYRFDANPQAADAAATWQAGGVEVAKPLGDLVGAPVLLPAGDDGAYVVACRRVDGKFRFVIRHLTATGELTEKTMDPLDAPPAGPPALGPGAIVVPLADSTLCRIPLGAGTTRCDPGPNWRALGAKSDAPGFVVHWRGDEYLYSDGTRRLLRIIWRTDKYEMGTETPLDLRQRLTAVMPLSRKGEEPRAIVADNSGTLTLVTGAVPKAVRTWRLGTVTAGPWETGAAVAVVVDRTKLVMLDPEKDEPLWSADAPGDGIEVRPRIIDGRLIVADTAGLFVALDPTTGKRLGTGFRHPAVVAPTAAPVAIGGGRVFAPLTDGSALLLPAAELLKPEN